MPKFDYSVVKDHKYYSFVMRAIRPIANHLYDLRIEGKENIPPCGGRLILAANHMSFKDPAILGTIVGPDHPFHFMGKQELFDNPFLYVVFKACNGFPVKRGEHHDEAIEYAKQVVLTGRTLGLFIEGTRSKDGKLGEPKLGIASIARDTKADILPVSLYNEEKGAFHSAVTVRFGKVIPHAELKFDGSGSKDELIVVANQVMDEIRVMWEGGHCVPKTGLI